MIWREEGNLLFLRVMRISFKLAIASGFYYSCFTVSTVFALWAGASPSYAAKPGAFAVTETKSAMGNRAAKPPRTKNRCFSAEQIDKDGFLYPDKLLAQHFSQCRIKDSKRVNKNRKEWSIQCGAMLTAQAYQVNSGQNFDLHIDAKLLGGAMKQTLDFSSISLKRACTAQDSRLE